MSATMKREAFDLPAAAGPRKAAHLIFGYVAPEPGGEVYNFHRKDSYVMEFQRRTATLYDPEGNLVMRTGPITTAEGFCRVLAAFLDSAWVDV